MYLGSVRVCFSVLNWLPLEITKATSTSRRGGCLPCTVRAETWSPTRSPAGSRVAAPPVLQFSSHPAFLLWRLWHIGTRLASYDLLRLGSGSCCRLVANYTGPSLAAGRWMKRMRTGYDDLVSIVFFFGSRDSLVRMLCFIYCLVNISIYKSITTEVVCIYMQRNLAVPCITLCYILLFLIWELALLLFLVCSLVFLL